MTDDEVDALNAQIETLGIFFEHEATEPDPEPIAREATPAQRRALLESKVFGLQRMVLNNLIVALATEQLRAVGDDARHAPEAKTRRTEAIASLTETKKAGDA